MRELTLTVSGMKCDGCAESVREALAAVSGVESVEITLDRGEARVTADETTGRDELKTAVEGAGYTVDDAA